MTLQNTRILIVGAGIAGTTLAFWLKRYGFRPTVVERAPLVREGGYPVDVRDEAVEIARHMGIWPTLQKQATTLNRLSFIDGQNRCIGSMNFLKMRATLNLDSTWAEVMRGDLAKTLYETSKDEVEYLFCDSIQELTQDDSGIDVTFVSGNKRRFDLVLGADGLHSAVRALAFGDEAQFEYYCGYYVAIFSVVNHLKLDQKQMLVYGIPGKQVMLRGSRDDRTLGVCLMFQQPSKLSDARHDQELQKRLLAATYAGLGWEVPGFLEQLRAVDDLFFDSVSQIRMEAWSSRRIALAGDAAHSPALLTGQGSTLAMMGAYTLAGELYRTQGDYQKAFQAYEQSFKPLVSKEQKKLKTGSAFLVPATSLGMWTRNHLSPLLTPLIVVPGGIWKKFRPGSITLEDYQKSIV